MVVVLFIEHDAMNEGSEWCSGTWRYIMSSSTNFHIASGVGSFAKEGSGSRVRDLCEKQGAF